MTIAVLLFLRPLDFWVLSHQSLHSLSVLFCFEQYVVKGGPTAGSISWQSTTSKVLSILEHCWLLKTYHVVMVLGFYLAFLCIGTAAFSNFWGKTHLQTILFELIKLEWQKNFKIKCECLDIFTGILQLLDTLRYHIIYTVQLRNELNSEEKLEPCLSEKKGGIHITVDTVRAHAWKKPVVTKSPQLDN